MDTVTPETDAYLQSLLVPIDPLLEEIEAYGETQHFPVIGRQVGRLLYLIARSIQARQVLELGSGFGYSALWFAHAVGPSGRVVMTEGSRGQADRALGYFERAGMLDRVESHVGDAFEIAHSLKGPFDIVLNDANKKQYPMALQVARDKLRVGGYLISDNMLWHGRVVTGVQDLDTENVRELTRLLVQAPDFITTLLPVRDGVTLSLRVS